MFNRLFGFLSDFFQTGKSKISSIGSSIYDRTVHTIKALGPGIYNLLKTMTEIFPLALISFSALYALYALAASTGWAFFIPDLLSSLPLTSIAQTFILFLLFLVMFGMLFAFLRSRGRRYYFLMLTDRRGIWWFDLLIIAVVVVVQLSVWRYFRLNREEIWMNGVCILLASLISVLKKSRVYVVSHPGETLSSISERMNCPLNLLMELNPDAGEDSQSIQNREERKLQVGTEIFLG